MNKKNIILLVLLAIISMSIFSCSAKRGIRPEDLSYEPLVFSPPQAQDYRVTLSNGLVVYIAENNEIPWFEASLMMKTGPFLEPADKIGIAGLTESIMRVGGTKSMTGEQINERMDFLAGNVSATNLSINMKYLDEGLKIWDDILNNPAFPEDKIRRSKEAMTNSVKNRNKNVTTVGGSTFSNLIYGENSPINASQTEEMINGLNQNDLINWHTKYWGANNAILIVSGDFKKADMLKKLEAVFGKWRNAEKAVPRIPKAIKSVKGVYMVEPEVIPNQGVIRIGHLGIKRDNPDYPAVDIMNYILGGGSFSSRITRTVRSDQGLAYSTSSSFAGGTLYDGTFSASCQTKNATVVFACQLMLNEIDKIREEAVSAEDLNLAKSSRINAFPSQFSSISSILSTLASLEFNNQPMDFYDKYIASYEKVTIEDVQRVAKKYLQPENMVIMVSGNISECKAGADNSLPNQQMIDKMAAKFGGRTMEGLAKKYGNGTVNIVPLK